MKSRNLCVCAFGVFFSCTGCAEGKGTLQVYLQAEETISNGVFAGSDPDNIVDGWTIHYDAFLATVGAVNVFRSGAPNEVLSDPSVYIVDLATLPKTGFALAEFQGIDAGRWDRVSYDMPRATSDAHRDSSVTESDAQRMIENAYTFWIRGSATKGAKEIRFNWGVASPTNFSDCGPEQGDLGVAVGSGTTTTAEATIHGDHIWFDSFPAGTEGVVTRRANWIETADRDHNDEVTEAELSLSPSNELFGPPTYSLTGAPILIHNALDWVIAQQHTVGHFQGEGECAWAILP